MKPLPVRLPFKSAAVRAISGDSVLGRAVSTAFHVHWHYSGAWTKNTYLGYPIQQSPFDLHAYQELIFRVRPEFIVQTGVAYGGSLLYLAHLLDNIGADPSVPVIGIDITLYESAKTLDHPRIRLIEGNSVDEAVVEQVWSIVCGAEHGLVSLDSDHSQAHVAREIECYRELVGVGSYLVVEDVDLNGHPVLPGYGPGPFEAARAFLRSDDRFVRDDTVWRNNRVTAHGWYRRLRRFPVRGYVPARDRVPPRAA